MITGVIHNGGQLSGVVDGGQMLTGSATAAQEITGEVSGTGELTGEVSQAEELTGEVNPVGIMEGSMSAAYGTPGRDGKDGKDGYTPVKGIDYFDGKDGYTPVKGVDYFDGEPGADGQPGKDGYTPKRGIDYWTDADKTEIVQQTKDAISVPTKTSQLTNDSDFVTLAGIKPTYFIPYYEKPTSFGCTNADDLTTIVSTMPNNSNCTFWINATQFPAVYNEIHQFNKNNGLNEAFGCVTLEKRSNVVRVKWECYRNMFTVVNSWTSVNSRGWAGWQVLIPFTA